MCFDETKKESCTENVNQGIINQVLDGKQKAFRVELKINYKLL